MAAVPTAFIFLLILLLPVIGGVILIIMSRRRGKGYPACGQCGYDVSGTLGTTTARCPECGSDFGCRGHSASKVADEQDGPVIGIAMVGVPLLCVGGMMLTTYFAFLQSSQARQAAVAAQATAAQQQAAAMAAAQGSLPPAASSEIMAEVPEGTPDDIALTLTTALTQEQVDAMNESDVREALARVSKARQFVDDAMVRERLKREFEAIMLRMRTLRDSTRP